MLKNKQFKYDNIISLGYNCQTAFVLEAFSSGSLPSNFFNWVFVPDLRNIISFITNPNIICSSGLIFDEQYFMYKDEIAGFSYHTISPHNIFFDENKNLNKKAVDKDIINVKSKMCYLKDKFLKDLYSNQKNLYLLTHPNWGKANEKEITENIEQLSDLMKANCGNKDSKILIIFDAKYSEGIKLNKHSNILYAYINKLPDVSQADNSNFIAWANILRKFEIKNLDFKFSDSRVLKFKKERNLKIKFLERLYRI